MLPARRVLSVPVALLCLACTYSAAFAQITYQIDNGALATGFNNTLGTETSFNQAEDNWVGNVFTAAAGGSRLDSITFETFSDLNASTLPSPFITAALYLGSPGSGLTLVSGSVNTVALNASGLSFVTVPFLTPQLVGSGQVFTAALLIDNVPSSVFPFAGDSSGVSTNSFYDISQPVGSVGIYDMASPNHPTPNGATYFGQPAGATNTNASTTILRVNAVRVVPEPDSLAVFVGLSVGGASLLLRRRR